MTTTSQRFFVLIVVSFCLFSQINAVDLIASASCRPTEEPKQDTECCENNAIYVSGNSEITVIPDTTILTITVKACKDTWAQAVAKLDTAVDKVKSTLLASCATDKIIVASGITSKPVSFDTKCHNALDFNSRLLSATTTESDDVCVQTVLVVRVTVVKDSKIAAILDKLTCFTEISCVQVTYDKAEIKYYLKDARKAALEDAKNKAIYLASKTDKTVGKLLTIIDETSSVDIVKSDVQRKFGKIIPTDDITPEFYEIEYAVKLKYALVCK